MFRFAVLCLLAAISSCVNTPDGPRSALVFNNTSLLETDPEAFRAAYQTNLPPKAIPDDPGLAMKFTRTDGSVLMERTISMQRIVHGENVGFDLPPAREAQTWTIWKPDAAGVATFREIQASVADATENGEKGTLGINWKFGRGDDVGNMKVVYVTFALKLAPTDPWFTLMDNLPVYPEKGKDLK